MMKSPHIVLAKKYWQNHLKPGDIVVDATCGNGKDTLFLRELKANVFSLDIQEIAIENARKLLKKFADVQFLNISHTRINEIPFSKSPRLIVYNLGYLPGGDKSLTTKTTTTLESLQKSLKLLSPGGAISITCYPGHLEGSLEEEAILEYISSLPKNEWTVCYHKYLNRPRSPSLIWMIKEGKFFHIPKNTQEEYLV